MMSVEISTKNNNICIYIQCIFERLIDDIKISIYIYINIHIHSVYSKRLIDDVEI